MEPGGIVARYLVEGPALCVRRVEEADLPALHRWLSDPRVLEWYEGRDQVFDQRRVREEFLDLPGDTTPCIVEFDSQPAGYVQFADLTGEDKERLGYETGSSIFGLDQFIGEPSLWGQGKGTRLVRAMTGFLCETFHPGLVVVDPQVENARAIHVYEKCGFRPARTLPNAEYHEGAWRDCLLMEYRCSLTATSV